MSVDGQPQTGRHILMELGFSARRSGDELHGIASVTPQMHVPGTAQLRTSILATWADTLAAEEAVLSLVPGDALCSLGLRYLQAVRAGPVVATARVHRGLGQVELRDSGHGDRLSVIATARTFEKGVLP